MMCQHTSPTGWPMCAGLIVFRARVWKAGCRLVSCAPQPPPLQRQVLAAMPEGSFVQTDTGEGSALLREAFQQASLAMAKHENEKDMSAAIKAHSNGCVCFGFDT